MPGPDWLYLVGGACAVLLAALPGVWWWRGDGVRSARCPWCRYPLPEPGARAARPVCPECGRTARSDRALHRPTRRRRWLLLTTALLLAGAVAICTPTARSRGAWSLLPDWMIWQIAHVKPSLGRGFAQRLGGIVLADRTGRSAQRLYDIDPSVRVTRDRWVKGVPLRTRITFSFDPGGPVDPSVVFIHGLQETDDAQPDQQRSHHNFWRSSSDRTIRGSTSDMLVLPSLNARPMLAGEDTRMPIAHTVVLVDSLDKVLSPHPVPASSLRAALAPSLVVMPDAPLLALAVNDVPGSLVPARVTIGVSISIVAPTGEVHARGRWYQRSGVSPMLGRPVLVRWLPRTASDAPNSPMPPGISLASLVSSGYIARFETDPEMALGDLDATGYVPVSFEVPLKELVK